MDLHDRHLKDLSEKSAIALEVIQERGYRTITSKQSLKKYDFAAVQERIPGLLLPLWAPDGSQPIAQYRPDNPRRGGKKHKTIKYEYPARHAMRIDVPPRCRSKLEDPSIPLWLTEGIKKGDALASQGACVLALLGVWNFKGRNVFGGKTLLADFDYVAWHGRDVRVAFDSDIATNPDVRQALERLTEHLQRKGAVVRVVTLPSLEGSKTGVDDFFAAGHTMQDLEALLASPRASPRATPPTLEFFGEMPKSITRPLTLVDGHGYAATWLWVRITTTEVLNKQGEVIRLPEPRIEDRLERFIVRDDGVLFGDVEAPHVHSLRTLDLHIHLAEPPPPNKLWSPSGVQAYLRGERPDPKTVFSQVADIVDRFIDFSRSLADQRTMSELVACYILSTWFIDAFVVIGFLWPNGERGSGKTQLLNVVTELAYLGQTILAGGSYASLRDLADYGACLAFDDAEAVMDVKRTDPDKRALLLAGNRRGSFVPVKEPVNSREWRTRYVNTFCPRLFSAIRMPDAVLASRTIVVPLIRTPDRYRANADPLNYALWPHKRELMLDELWALALNHSREIPAYVEQASEQAALSGRNLEPWQAIFAVALWLEEHGCVDIFKRMNDLSQAYQKERPDLEIADLTALVIRALVQAVTGKNTRSMESIKSMRIEGPEDVKTHPVTTACVTNEAQAIVQDEELDMDVDRITSRRVGRVLATLRIQKDPRTSVRQWLVSAQDLIRLALAFGLLSSDEALADHEAVPPYANAPNASNASNALDGSAACDEEEGEWRA